MTMHRLEISFHGTASTNKFRDLPVSLSNRNIGAFACNVTNIINIYKYLSRV